PMDTAGHEINILLPESATRPLWKHLLGELRDHFFPEKFPPLHLSSRPVNLGMLLGDYVTLPWYRTVFTNIGNVITPDVQAPLELTSKPADASLRSGSIEIQRWSSLISLPKVPPAQQAEFRTTPVKIPIPRAPITVPMPAIAGGPSGVLQRPSAADAHGDKLR